MSLSEIIAQRFKKNAVINEVKTPEEVAEIIIKSHSEPKNVIKSPEEANLLQNVEGDVSEQQAAQKKIEDIETNRMYAWSDLSKVKHDLWYKLHAVGSMMGQQVSNLAQLLSHHGH